MHTREPNDAFQEHFQVPYEHAVASATTTWKLRTIRRPCRLDDVEYINDTGYTQDATNYYKVELLKGATVIASWSCLTGAQGSIAAATPVTLVNSATDTDLVFAVGDVLSLRATKVAAGANLPLGRICANLRLV